VGEHKFVPLFPFDGVLGLDAEDEIVVCCHHGARSDAGAQILIESGFPRVANLIGGIGTHTHLRGRSGRATGWATRPKTGCFALSRRFSLGCVGPTRA
jgi:hypothetical protein